MVCEERAVQSWKGPDARNLVDSVPMRTCSPKYCGVLSFILAPATFDREKTPLDPRTGCNSRCQKETASPQERARSESLVGKYRREWLWPPPSQISYSEP
ncbi:hypothetical protein TNCV_2134981 [Trichonephila clavipes]|nr:hypothetical protein TNCV_2134981 [Trichonephila clavipes]